MLHTLTLPDGQVIGSGAGEPAVRSAAVTASVGSARPGGVEAAELDITLFGPVSVRPGDRLALHADGAAAGVFFAQKVTAPAPGQVQILAYDAVSKLDGTADGFLDGLTFPVTLGSLARGLAQYFGLELTGTLLNADYEVPKFLYRGVTGRQLMAWVCQAGGRFCVAEGDGLRLGWFEDSGIALLSGTEQFVYQDGCRLAEDPLPPVQRVVIRGSESDVGTAAGEGETWFVTGNPLLCGENAEAAQTLLDALSGFSYTPGTVVTNAPLRPGRLFWARGKLCAAVTVEQKEGSYRVSAPEATASSAAGPGITARLAGRVTRLQMDLQEVSSRMAEFGEEVTKVAALSQDVDHITAQVAVLRTDAEAMDKTLEELTDSARRSFAELALRSDGLELTVGQMEHALDGKADAGQLQELTEHFRFDEAGLTISDSRSGMGITLSEDAVAFAGGAATTRMTPTGMTTTDLQVEDRLTVGDFILLPRTGGNLSLRWLER